MNLFARQGRTLMTAATAAAVVAAGGMGAGCAKSPPTIIETVNGYTFEMMPVADGKFTMGCTSEQGDDCDDWEKPAHPVTLDSYYIGKYEVTQGLWKAVMGSLPPKFSKDSSAGRGLYFLPWAGDSLFGAGDNYPIYFVSWNDVQIFIYSLNRLTGKTYRLPTEAEWEFAARGGNKSRRYKYSGSNNIDNVAWYGYDSGGGGGTSGATANPVGTKSPNELGIHDMNGNVWEWVNDSYIKDYYSSSPSNNPKGPEEESSNRVIRGGSWRNAAKTCRVSNHHGSPAHVYIYNVGFRLALGGTDAGSAKKSGPETLSKTIDTISARTDTTPVSHDTIPVIHDMPAIEMVRVARGTFTMGCTGCNRVAEPAHSVTLSSYYIGKYEVTQRLWMAVMGSLPLGYEEYSSYGMGYNYPVYFVTWNDIVTKFIPKLNKGISKKGEFFYMD